jgi:hypothetical protein
MSDHDKANAEAAAVMLLTAALDEMRNGQSRKPLSLPAWR